MLSSKKLNRRDLLRTVSGGFAMTAFSGMCDSSVSANDPLSASRSHFTAKVDNVIFIYATGGVSHVDTFDYKPKLIKDHGKSIVASRWLNKAGEF